MNNSNLLPYDGHAIVLEMDDRNSMFNIPDLKYYYSNDFIFSKIRDGVTLALFYDKKKDEYFLLAEIKDNQRVKDKKWARFSRNGYKYFLEYGTITNIEEDKLNREKMKNYLGNRYFNHQNGCLLSPEELDRILLK